MFPSLCHLGAQNLAVTQVYSCLGVEIRALPLGASGALRF